jgi:hypothetical protein
LGPLSRIGSAAQAAFGLPSTTSRSSEPSAASNRGSSRKPGSRWKRSRSRGSTGRSLYR